MCTCARPGREDENDRVSAPRPRAAGGYCAILAMPNTEPVVDSAAVLGSLVEQAHATLRSRRLSRGDHEGPAGSGADEMGELADAGAVGFTDDGRPFDSPA